MDALGIDVKFIAVQLVGFVLLVWLLSKYAFGPIFNLLQQRQDTIRHNLDEAEARRAEMVRLQHDYEERLAKIEDEARDKIQSAVKEAQAARDEIIERARADSQALVQRGHEDVARERDKAMVEMRNEIAELAIAAASRVVKQSLNGQSHARLIDDVISGIGRNGNSGATGGGAAGGGRPGGAA